MNTSDLQVAKELRELNKSIATRLSSVPLVFVEVEIDNRIEVHSHSFNKNTSWFVVPNYSVSMDSALMLIHDLPQGYQFVLTVNARGQWKALFRCRYDASKDKIGKADTPSLAICKMWLEWSQLSERKTKVKS